MAPQGRDHHDSSEQRTAIVVFAHGSTVEKANEGCREVTAELARRGRWELVDTSFLDCAQPDLRTSIANMVARGATRIIVVPFFLTLGIHLRRDLPGIVSGLASIHEGVSIEVTSPLEGHPALVDIMQERAVEALGRSTSESNTR